MVWFIPGPARNGLSALLLSLVLTGCSRPMVQLIRSPETLTQGSSEPWVRSVQERFKRQRIDIIDKNRQHHQLPADSVWGYRLSTGETYRFHERTGYELMQREPVCIYRVIDWIGDSRWEDYYFSLTASSPIWPLDKKTCLHIFASNPCMMHVLEQMRPRHLLERDKKGMYGLANACTYCNTVTTQRSSARKRFD